MTGITDEVDQVLYCCRMPEMMRLEQWLLDKGKRCGVTIRPPS